MQALDLRINGSTKINLKRKFSDRYTDQVYQLHEESKEVEELDVKLSLTTLKPLNSESIVKLYNLFSSAE